MKDKDVMLPRITGTEMEWSTLVQETSASHESVDSHKIEYSLRPENMPAGLIGAREFLSNGSRLYRDCNGQLEYATPEDASIMGTVANEIAGERIMQHILSSTKERGDIYNFVLNKRVVDEYLSGTSWGYHENYLVPMDTIEISQGGLALLGIHLATRNIFVGAGSMRRSRDGARYFLAQKALSLDTDFSHNTTKWKPVVNLRHEPLADEKLWQRIHVTSGDPNMSPWATFMKLGTTSLVLRLIENDIHLKHLRVKSIRDLGILVAKDLALKEVVVLENHKTIRPIDIQAQLMMAARKLAKDVDLPQEESLVLDEWERAINDASVDPDLLEDRSDWVKKKMILNRYGQRRGDELIMDDLFVKDRQYDNTGDLGFGVRLRRKFWADWMPTEEDIQRRILTPPNNTRAHARGRLIGTFANRIYCVASWDSVILGGKKPIPLPNPYMTTHKLIEEMLSIPEEVIAEYQSAT
jgi:hypothetical protein